MAAGLGFKTFTTGEVLTAADTNGYLMQGINVFASTAARDAAITSPQEGQFAYTKDTNSLWYYTGSAWAASGATGDIEGVTAGVGITGGGTSGTVTITNDMATTITAAGDIVIGTGSGTYDNLPIGTTAQVLTADTTVSPYKVKWAAPAGGGKILQTVFGSSTTLVNNTTSTYVTTGATATITPSAATSKIIVLASINGLYWDSGTTSLDFKLMRGATAIAAITQVQEGMASASSTSSVAFTYQDSPSTTSATTYDVTYATDTPTGRARIGHPASGSTFSIQSIILMEVGV